MDAADGGGCKQRGVIGQGQGGDWSLVGVEGIGRFPGHRRKDHDLLSLAVNDGAPSVLAQ